MSAVAGLLSVANANTSDLVGEYQETILVRNAKGFNVGTTLFGLMSRLKTEEAENSEFNWFERDPTRREIYANANDATPPAAQDEADTIVFSETSGAGNAFPYLAAGHVLRNDRTGEHVLVTATPTTNTVAVNRAIDTTDATTLLTYTIVTGDVWSIITLGKFEGDTPTQASYEEPTILTNYVQTYNAVVELTNAFKGNKLRTDQDGPLRDRRLQALEKVAKDIELSLFLGVKRRILASSKYQYFTGGLKQSIDVGAPNNALNGGGSAGIDLDTFNGWLQNFLTVGSDAKLAFCGPAAYATISNFANQAVNGFRIMNQETVFGMNITVINTPYGEIDLAMHPLFKEITQFSDWMFVVDLAHLVQKTMEPLFLESNIQTPGQDSYKEQYRAKLGLKLKFAQAFGYCKDLQKIV
jgi:hypothetical protein